MGQPHSQPHQPAPTGKWLDGFKLAFLTSAVAALQFLRYQLTREERRQVRRCRGGQQAHNFIGDLPADFRRACVSLIDYHAMPLLVDQWRLKLVSVLLSPENGPVLDEDHPDNRQNLLGSLNTYQEARRAADLRTSRPVQPAPMPAQASTPSAPPWQQEAASTHSDEYVPYPVVGASDDRQASIQFQGAALPPEVTAGPSAPPRTGSFDKGMHGAHEDALPEADPSPEDGGEECGICYAAEIEVQIDSCKHGMCIECARAICSMPNRGAQCPFCRGPIASISPVPTRA